MNGAEATRPHGSGRVLGHQPPVRRRRERRPRGGGRHGEGIPKDGGRPHLSTPSSRPRRTARGWGSASPSCTDRRVPRGPDRAPDPGGAGDGRSRSRCSRLRGEPRDRGRLRRCRAGEVSVLAVAPVGPAPAEVLAAMEAALDSAFGLPVARLAAIDEPAAAFSPKRGQWSSVAFLRPSSPACRRGGSRAGGDRARPLRARAELRLRPDPARGKGRRRLPGRLRPESTACPRARGPRPSARPRRRCTRWPHVRPRPLRRPPLPDVAVDRPPRPRRKTATPCPPAGRCSRGAVRCGARPPHRRRRPFMRSRWHILVVDDEEADDGVARGPGCARTATPSTPPPRGGRRSRWPAPASTRSTSSTSRCQAARRHRDRMMEIRKLQKGPPSSSSPPTHGGHRDRGHEGGAQEYVVKPCHPQRSRSSWSASSG